MRRSLGPHRLGTDAREDGQWIFDKGAKAIPNSKEKTGNGNLSLHLTPYTKMNSKWIISLNGNCASVKL